MAAYIPHGPQYILMARIYKRGKVDSPVVLFYNESFTSQNVMFPGTFFKDQKRMNNYQDPCIFHLSHNKLFYTNHSILFLINFDQKNYIE